MAQGFGRDLWCENYLVTRRYATGVRLVAQALYRRLTTPRGALQGSAEASVYGVDLAGFVGTANPEVVALNLPGMIEAECRKDDRVADVRAKVEASQVGAGLTRFDVEVRVTLHDSGTNFRFTLRVSNVGVELLGVAA
jgi:hypothetical protein